VKLQVLDLQGRVVTTLEDGQRSPGKHSIEWDGRDGEGRRLGAGVYWYRFRSERFQAQRKMTVMP